MFNQNTFMIEYDNIKSALDWYAVPLWFRGKSGTGILFYEF